MHFDHSWVVIWPNLIYIYIHTLEWQQYVLKRQYHCLTGKLWYHHRLPLTHRYSACWMQNILGLAIGTQDGLNHYISLGCGKTWNFGAAFNGGLVWNTSFLLFYLKRKCHHFDEIFITACIGSCQNDNFQCSQWWKYHQNDDIFVSVLG